MGNKLRSTRAELVGKFGHEPKAPECEICGKAKPSVVKRTDPYERQVNGVVIWRFLCLECEQNRRDKT